ncbi:regulator of chromosome condensation 1/beta-lactamase-inhibitor protein II [Lyophyllum atratum]|nr:regulator of chromosome condensation 1/beta-lactamase-inhibitor protein II [Lyophyllum atratum]
MWGYGLVRLFQIRRYDDGLNERPPPPFRRPKLGKKERGGAAKGDAGEEYDHPDLLEPHILRSLSNVPILSVHTSCNGCHFVCLDLSGAAWLFGRNGFGCLGIAGDEYVSENAPMRVEPGDVGAGKGVRFVGAACGRNHTLLVGSDGSVWAAGQNNLGQCGQAVCPEVTSFKLVNGIVHNGEKEHVIKASAGVTFSLVLTASGKVFSFGSAEKGQLGNGTTGERITTGNKTAFDIETTPVYIKELDGKNIVEITSGQQHSLALDDTGVVYVWGYNGYCRLGLGNQVDILKPKAVPQFAGPNDTTMGVLIAAGPSSSIVVDKQGMFYMAGKWKNSGEGSSGSPYSTFRFIQDIMGCKITLARSGGVTHWALTPDDDDTVMTVAWGQNAANGELGLGPDEPKSATKPTRSAPLVGVDVFDIAAGQNTTVLLAKPNDKMSDLPRHPEDVQPPPLCVVCKTERGEDDSPLECDKCDSPYHLGCLTPPLSAVPPGEWFCVACARAPGAPIGRYPPRKAKLHKAKASRATASKVHKEEDGEEEAEGEVETGGKRKAGGKGKAGAPKKKKQ